MNKAIDWHAVCSPLNLCDIYVPAGHLCRWIEYMPCETGVAFRCETTDRRTVEFRLDIVMPDVVRVRMNPDRIRSGPSDMLIQQDWPPPPYDLKVHEDYLVLTTERIRLEVQRLPWQLRIFDAQSLGNITPFFSQRVDDRVYGSRYEVAPIGFDRDPKGRLTVRETVAVTPGECFYGFGEKFTPLNKWGQELVSWTVDAGNVSSHRSYKNIPFFMSTAGYGLFVHSSYPILYRMGSESSISYSIHIDDSQLDYFLIYGPDFKHILKRYCDLTGYAPVPPQWAFGFWISRCSYQSRQEVEAIIREMRARDFPCDVIHLDPWWMGNGPWSTYEWDTESFPNPEEMIRGLRTQGVRVCLWIHPYIPKGTKAYDEVLAKGYYVHSPDGHVSPPVDYFLGSDLAVLDFTNPQACAWLESKLQPLLDMGVAAFKTDFGEQAPVDAVYYDGRSGLEMHNLYPLLYNRTVFELTRRHYGRGLVWGRSAYAGSQRYPVQWGGDSYGSFDQLASQMRGLLSYGMSGVPFCSHDVGGFDYSPSAFDWPKPEEYPKDPVLYVRWLQFGVFSSHVRAHGKQPREPWTYGPQAEEIARRYLKLRYRLLPYIYSEAVKSAQTGLPMVRPLVLEFQSDPNTYSLDLQYMFGNSFLVAPIVTPSNHRLVYLPPGDWVDYWSKRLVKGGCWIEVEAPLEIIPLWVRAGAIIPMGPELSYVEEKPLDPLTLELYWPHDFMETIVQEEDQPGIPVRYKRKGKRLNIEAGPAPGQVEIVLYGEPIQEASCDGVALDVLPCPGGQFVRIDGSKRVSVVLRLAEG